MGSLHFFIHSGSPTLFIGLYPTLLFCTWNWLNFGQQESLQAGLHLWDTSRQFWEYILTPRYKGFHVWLVPSLPQPWNQASLQGGLAPQRRMQARVLLLLGPIAGETS